MSRSYRPSNGTEGMAFIDAWCANCVHDRATREDRPEDGCRIVAETMALAVDDPAYPEEWVVDAEGAPRCTAFERDEGLPSRCPDTVDMFGKAGPCA